MAQQLRLYLGQTAVARLEEVTDAGMQLPPAATQQRLVCSFLDQGVLEDLGGIGWDTPLVDQPRIDKLTERGVQTLL